MSSRTFGLSVLVVVSLVTPNLHAVPPATAPSVATTSAAHPATNPAAKAVRRARLDWNRKNTVGAYDQFGHHDPKWGAAAHEMLEAYARKISMDVTPTRDEDDIILTASGITTKAKCDDPLILYVTSRSMVSWHRKTESIIAVAQSGIDSMRASQYSPALKFYALLRLAALRQQTSPKPGESVAAPKELVDEAVTLLPAIIDLPNAPRDTILDVMLDLGHVSKLIFDDREKYAAPAFKVLDDKCKDRSLVLSVMCQFYVDYAWDARGSGFADKVTDEGFKQMAERLEPAAAAGEKAWELDHQNAFAAQQMITVELGQGQGRERMETWFNRAMEADADSYSACACKENYLEPKWYGSPKELLEFGRECRDKGNYDAGIPLILVDTHLDLAAYEEGVDTYAKRRAYFQQNPQAWADVKAVYDEYLRRVPESRYHRSRYAEIAAWCGQWEEAERQFKAMNDRFSFGWFRTATHYRQVRLEVQTHLEHPSPQ